MKEDVTPYCERLVDLQRQLPEQTIRWVLTNKELDYFKGFKSIAFFTTFCRNSLLTSVISSDLPPSKRNSLQQLDAIIMSSI